jgi:pyruvate/2-oxoglutarate dehydrogenase complex dihydrolipoamide acyltransferase (E2) component
VNRAKGYRVKPFGFNRRMVAASASVGKEKDTIHLIAEVDISKPRQWIAAYKKHTGDRLSLTGYVVYCLARTLSEYPEFNSFRKGNRLIVLDHVTVSVLFERNIGGENVPEPVGIREAEKKTYKQIHDALRSVQAKKAERLGSATGMDLVRFIPPFLLRMFVRLASKSIAMQKRYGVIGVTAVGMFGAGSLWLVPLTSATVTVAIGSIAVRPVIVGGELQEHEFLCLTLSFDHDIIDGAPAARFTRRFSEMLSGGSDIAELVDSLSAR